MQVRELLRGTVEAITWEKPASVGTARVITVLRPWHDEVFLDIGSGDELTRGGQIFVPTGLFKKGEVVEVIVKKARFQSVPDRRLGLLPVCQIAIRPFHKSTFGKITVEDEKKLAPIFAHPQNRTDPLWDRAFYRKFLGGTLRPITPDDVQGSGQNL